jgi:hypothetical protein
MVHVTRLMRAVVLLGHDAFIGGRSCEVRGMPSSRRQVVFVSGAPGAGKTSLAVPLAAELGFALVRKDRIKETLHDGLGAPPPDLAWSRKLGAGRRPRPPAGVTRTSRRPVKKCPAR